MAYLYLEKMSNYKQNESGSLQEMVLSFIRNRCEGLRFDSSREDEKTTQKYTGKSNKPGVIPYNMQMDIDRLCLENAVKRFLASGRKEDAFDVYFCYMEMFIGSYNNCNRMIELLSEYENNGSSMLMKHRDHYSHSVYVFLIGIAIFESNEKFRDTYTEFYKDSLKKDQTIAHHFLEYWGLAALFHDIGYPFEIPFEMVCSYFEERGANEDREKTKRSDWPFISFNNIARYRTINYNNKKQLEKLYGRAFSSTDELYAYELENKLGSVYNKTESYFADVFDRKTKSPGEFSCFMDHAYFSATVLFRELTESIGSEKLDRAHIDALTAIIMHNSLYKFSIADYKTDGNIPFNMELHPLAYLLMLCDELQCWDRVSYGRESRKEVHPFDCEFHFDSRRIEAVYCFDDAEDSMEKINEYEKKYSEYKEMSRSDPKMEKPKLKAYSSFNDGSFAKDIRRIVAIDEMADGSIQLSVDKKIKKVDRSLKKTYLSSSNFMHLYDFAIALNDRYSYYELGSKDCDVNKIVLHERIQQIESFNGLSLEYKLSNINQAKAFARYLNEIGSFYTDKAVDFEMVSEFTAAELEKIGPMEHKRWLQEHYDMGWVYGEPTKEQRDLLRAHRDMIPGGDDTVIVTDKAAKDNYDRLSKAEQDKDTKPMILLLKLLRQYDGLRIYRI